MKEWIKKYSTYMSYLLRHKWFVFVECCKEGLFWQGLVHDCSKFLPSELIPYANFFYKKNPRDKTGYYHPIGHSAAFDFAWLLHQKRNRHHWQWWVLPADEGEFKVLEIPLNYRKEMVCDWKGASRAQKTTGTVKEWWLANNHKMTLGEKTRRWVEQKLEIKN